MTSTINIKKIQSEELEMLIEIDKICRNNKITYYLGYGSALGAVRHKGFIPWDTDIDLIIEIGKMDEFVEIVESILPEKYYLFSIKKDASYDSLKPRVGLRNERHHRIHVDIFPMVGLPQNKFIQMILPRLTLILYRFFFFKQFDSETIHKDNLKKKLKHRLVKLLLFPIPIKYIKSLFNYISKKYPIDNSNYIYNICGLGYREVIPKDYLGEPEYMEFEGYKFPVPKEWDKYLKHMYGDYMTPRQY